VGKRHTRRLSREHLGVVNLSRNPTLHQSNVLIGGKLDRLELVVQPGVRVGTNIYCQLQEANAGVDKKVATHTPADILGQVVGLQMLPWPSSFS
jgi:hypothetical protein